MGNDGYVDFDVDVDDDDDDDDEPEVEGSVFGLFTVVTLVLPFIAWWGFWQVGGIWQVVIFVPALAVTVYALVVLVWVLLAVNLGRVVAWLTRDE